MRVSNMSDALTNLFVMTICTCFMVAWFSCVPQRLYDQLLAEFTNALLFESQDTFAVITNNPNVQASVVISLISLIVPICWMPLFGYARFVLNVVMLGVAVCFFICTFLLVNVLRYYF